MRKRLRFISSGLFLSFFFHFLVVLVAAIGSVVATRYTNLYPFDANGSDTIAKRRRCEQRAVSSKITIAGSSINNNTSNSNAFKFVVRKVNRFPHGRCTAYTHTQGAMPTTYIYIFYRCNNSRVPHKLKMNGETINRSGWNAKLKQKRPTPKAHSFEANEQVERKAFETKRVFSSFVRRRLSFGRDARALANFRFICFDKVLLLNVLAIIKLWSCCLTLTLTSTLITVCVRTHVDSIASHYYFAYLFIYAWQSLIRTTIRCVERARTFYHRNQL